MPIPDDYPEDQRIFGAAESVTQLLDGRGGGVLAESEPAIYNHNPGLGIPDEWWAPGHKPAKPGPRVEEKSRFKWDEAGREVRFAGDHTLRLEADHESELSGDGRFLAVHEDFPESRDGKTTVLMRVIDAETGTVHIARVESEFPDVLVEASWQVLCSERPDPKVLRGFHATGIDHFREPWGDW